MGSYYPDTHPDMEALQVRLLRDTPPWRKMEMLTALCEAARTLTLAGIYREHPEADAEQTRRILAERLLGIVLAEKVLADGDTAP